jgi:hypothetical protein
MHHTIVRHHTGTSNLHQGTEFTSISKVSATA